jgi:hypothetical protein
MPSGWARTHGHSDPAFCEPSSGLCLEKRLEPDKSVAQKKRWEKVFASMLERELGLAA